MPRKKSPTLTEAEYRLMQVLWDRGESSVAEVVDAIGDPPLAYNTVLTTMRILEQKGYVRHAEEGRAFRYYPAVARDEVSATAVKSLVRRFFGSPGRLALNLLQSEDLTAEELAHIRRLVDAAEPKS